MIDLPRAGGFNINISALSALFRQVTNSYKFLFFQALIEKVHHGPRLELADLGIEMLALAWYPHIYFRLSFGVQDQIGKVLDRLAFHLEDPSRIGHPTTRAVLRRAIANQWQSIGGPSLLRYVPTRLLSPFFPNIKEKHKDRDIPRLSREHFDDCRPLYRFSDNGSAIEIHPDWHNYLVTHRAIVTGWARWHWVRFLQSRNPNVPAIPDKLEPPLQREPLTRQRDFWRTILTHQPLPCLYSGKTLEPTNFALDHFIPWSFVCHDRLWNLVPVLPEFNSAKGNRLPEPECFPVFINCQVKALKLGPVVLSHQKWRKVAEDYIVDLRLAPEQL